MMRMVLVEIKASTGERWECQVRARTCAEAIARVLNWKRFRENPDIHTATARHVT